MPREREYPPDYVERCERQKFMFCNVCGDGEYRHSIVVHHINGDRSDGRLENLLPLCTGCHALVHKGVKVSAPIQNLQSKLMPEMPPTTHFQGWKRVEIPRGVSRVARDMRAETGVPLGEAIRYMVREGGYDV